MADDEGKLAARKPFPRPACPLLHQTLRQALSGRESHALGGQRESKSKSLRCHFGKMVFM